MRGVIGVAVLLLVFGVALILFITSDTVPQVQIGSPQEGGTVGGTVEITGTASSNSQVAGVKLRIDDGGWFMANDTSVNGTWDAWAATWDSTTVADGPHAITASAWDVSDKAGQTTIDVHVANPPWVTILSPIDQITVSGNITVAGESGDASKAGAVALVQVAIDPTPNGAEWRDATPTTPDWGQWSFAWNTTAYTLGNHVVVARAFDGGLYSQPWANGYSVDNRPFVRIVHPSGDPTLLETLNGIVVVHGTAGYLAGGHGVELVQVRIDNGSWSNATDTSLDLSWSLWAYQWNTTQYNDGEHDVFARSWDGDQYSESVRARVYVVNSCGPPLVSIVDPKDGDLVRGVVLIHGKSSSEFAKVVLVQLLIGDGDWIGATDTSPDASWTTWARAWDTTRRDDGCVDISARAWDGSTFSDVDTIAACVDNRNDTPAVAFENIGNGDMVSGLHLLHGYAGAAPGVQLVELEFDDGPWLRASDTGRTHAWSTWAFEWDTTTVPNGEHTVCARALDGTMYSEPACVTVNVQNFAGSADVLKASFRAMGGPAWLVLLNLLSAGSVPALAIGVPATYIWLRSHGYVGK